jgi:hypothetical protein
MSVCLAYVSHFIAGGGSSGLFAPGSGLNKDGDASDIFAKYRWLFARRE